MSTLHRIQPPKHVHTFVRWRDNQWKRDLYRCFDKHCHYFVERSFLEGKASLCTKCGSEFTLSKEDLKRAKPMCVNCSNTREAKQIRAARRLVSTANIAKMIESEVKNQEHENES